jgi:CheY-like chemotaxis protein
MLLPPGSVRYGEFEEPMRTKTLLVVDDEPTNLELIRMAVEDAGLPVRFVSATNGQEALRRARELVPDLVLMDMKMPVLDGWEATRRLKSDPRTAAIPVVALTAQAMAGDLERALAAGCDDCLTKPLDVRTFLVMLRERLG